MRTQAALLLGRKTFESFRGYWAARTGDATGIAAHLNRVPKFVLSGTLDAPAWENTTVLAGKLTEEVQALKTRPGCAGWSSSRQHYRQNELREPKRMSQAADPAGGGSYAVRSQRRTSTCCSGTRCRARVATDGPAAPCRRCRRSCRTRFSPAGWRSGPVVAPGIRVGCTGAHHRATGVAHLALSPVPGPPRHEDVPGAVPRVRHTASVAWLRRRLRGPRFLDCCPQDRATHAGVVLLVAPRGREYRLEPAVGAFATRFEFTALGSA